MRLSPLLASLRTAARALRRRARTTLLNVSSLALGVGVCLLAGLYVGTQLSYDRHHEDADRIVRIHEETGAYTYDDTWRYMEDFPGEAASTVLLPVTGVVRGTRPSGAETLHRTDALLYASPSVFDVFTYPLVRGDAATALRDPASIVISQEAAQRHFPVRDPVGQTLTLPGYEEQGPKDVTVTGVMERLPTTLHVRPDYLAPLENITDENGETWRWLYLYVRARGATTTGDVVAWLNAERDRRTPDNQHDLAAQTLTSIYLHSDLPWEIAPTGHLAYVWAFGIVGALVLVIACINYVNLTTAQVAERMRGVGLRKTFGASRRQVAVHVLAESLLVTGLAVAVGVLMAWLALPSLNRLAPDPVSLSALWGPAGALLLLSVTATTAVLASAYPAAYLSSLRPIQLFRGGVGAGRTSALRRVLVVTQFAVAIGLTAVTVIVVQQTRYLADKNLGLDRAHTLIVSTRLVDAPREARGQQLGVVEERLRRQQGVRATGRMAMRPNIDGKLFTDDLVVPGQAGDGQAGDTVAVEPLIGSEGMTRALGIPLQAGQRLDEAPEGILINRAAAERLGEAAQVGAPLRLVNRYRRLDTTTVVAGILDDFHYRSLRSPIVPTYFRVDDAWQINSNLFVRAEPGQARSVLSATREAWNDVMPAGTFEYTFMNDEFAQMHRADTQQRNLLLVLAGLALLVACLGLIGLVAYLADRRRAEIGVRKTLGASVASIVGLLSREVVAGLAVAFLVAVPLAYVAASAWLEQFAYRIDMGPVAFGAAGVIVGAFALGAAASQAYRAAQVDPAVAVRGD